MALQPDARRRLADPALAEGLWRSCQQANPEAFRHYRVVRLDRPSYFLPAGDVVFSVLVNPSQIPDQPPRGVLLRHAEAMNAYPLARFYFLRPVFDVENNYRLLPPALLRGEADGDRRVAQQIARWFGWAHRAERWAQRQASRAEEAAVRLVGRAVDSVRARFRDPAAPLSYGPSPRSLTALASAAEAEGRLEEAVRFRSAAAELLRRQDIDPVLCFELPERPGELWFESHWFEGVDGRTYVHY